MQDADRIAAAIDLRVRQLEDQGIRGMGLVDPMLGHMGDLQRIYNGATDRILRDLCRRYPGFERYARLMEEVSERNQAMTAAGTHPYGDLPELPEPLKANLLKLMRGAVELEREFQAAVDGGRIDQANQLAVLRRQWAADLQALVQDFRSSEVPLRAQAVVQKVVKAMAERIARLGEAG